MQIRNESNSIDEWTKFKIRIQYLKNELKSSNDLVSSTQLKLSGESATLQMDAYLFEQFHREKVTNIIPDKNYEKKECEKIIESRINMLEAIKERFLNDIKGCEKGLQANQERLANKVKSIGELQKELESKISEASQWEEGGQFFPIDLSEFGQSQEKLSKGEKFEEEARSFLKKMFQTVRENETGSVKNKELQNKILFLEGKLKAVLIDQYVLKQILGGCRDLEAQFQLKSVKIKDLDQKISHYERDFKSLKGQKHQLEQENKSLKNSLQGIKERIRLRLGIPRNAKIPDLSEIFRDFDEKWTVQAMKLEESQNLINFQQSMIQEKDAKIENLQKGYEDYAEEIKKVLLKRYIENDGPRNESLELERKFFQQDSKIADLEDMVSELLEQIQEKDAELNKMKAHLAHNSSSQIDFSEVINETREISNKKDSNGRLINGQENVRDKVLKIENIENNEENHQRVDQRYIDLTEDEEMQRKIEEFTRKAYQQKELNRNLATEDSKENIIKNSKTKTCDINKVSEPCSVNGKRRIESFLSNFQAPSLSTSGLSSRRELINEKENEGFIFKKSSSEGKQTRFKENFIIIDDTDDHVEEDEVMKKIKQE